MDSDAGECSLQKLLGTFNLGISCNVFLVNAQDYWPFGLRENADYHVLLRTWFPLRVDHVEDCIAVLDSGLCDFHQLEIQVRFGIVDSRGVKEDYLSSGVGIYSLDCVSRCLGD